MCIIIHRYSFCGPERSRLKETKCQESSKTPGAGRRRDHEDRSPVFREEILRKIQKKKKLKRKDLIPVLLSRADLEKIKEEVKMTNWVKCCVMIHRRGTTRGKAGKSGAVQRLILCLDKDGKTSLIVKAASDPSCWKNYSRNMDLAFCEIMNGEKRLPDGAVSFLYQSPNEHRGFPGFWLCGILAASG